MPEERLIRFVAGPDRAVVPDLARKLPGRGIWVAADRASLAAAVKRNAFARSAKAPLTAAADLPDLVERLLAVRVLSLLGLARRSGELLLGFEKTAAALTAGRAGALIEAADGAPDGRRKMLAALRRAPNAPKLLGCFESAELTAATGVENVVHGAYLVGRGAERWTLEVQRLSGFRPIVPESWRGEA